MKFCIECGAPRPSETAKFCGECGAAHVESSATQPNSDLTDAELRNKADTGDAEATKDLGVRAYRGGDLAAAHQWYSKAATLGHAGAMRNLGLLAYETGDKRKAIDWFTKSIRAGNFEATVDLGNLYLEDGKFDKARSAYLLGAESGDLAAMFSVALVGYHRGDLNEGVDWLHKASERGFTRATLALSERAETAGDVTAAERYREHAAEQGSSTACELFAVDALRRSDFTDALRWADQGLAVERKDSNDPDASTTALEALRAHAMNGLARTEEVSGILRGGTGRLYVLQVRRLHRNETWRFHEPLAAELTLALHDGDKEAAYARLDRGKDQMIHANMWEGDTVTLRCDLSPVTPEWYENPQTIRDMLPEDVRRKVETGELGVLLYEPGQPENEISLAIATPSTSDQTSHDSARIGSARIETLPARLNELSFSGECAEIALFTLEYPAQAFPEDFTELSSTERCAWFTVQADDDQWVAESFPDQGDELANWFGGYGHNDTFLTMEFQ